MRYRSLISSLLFPRHCPVCGKVQAWGEEICSSCEKKLPYTRAPFCLICGKPIPDDTAACCFDCRIFPKSFQGGCSLFLYNSTLHDAMIDYKYHNRRVLHSFFTDRILARCKKQVLSWNPDYIVPIPLHKNKRKKRGYNQAELLSRSLARRLNLSHLPDLLIRTIDTLPQKQFSPQARLSNLQKVFQINPRYYKQLKTCTSILLVDDIYTTGATMEACSRILHEAGVSRVYILTICIGVSRD